MVGKLVHVATYFVLLAILCFVIAAPQYCAFTDQDAQLPFCIAACVFGMVLVLKSLSEEVVAQGETPGAAKEPPTPPPEDKKRDPEPYTWDDYMADIEKGYSLDEVRERLGGRPFPRRPAPPPPPPPLTPIINLPIHQEYTCNGCGGDTQASHDAYCWRCRPLSVRCYRGGRIARRLRRRRERLRRRREEREFEKGLHDLYGNDNDLSQGAP